MRPAPTSTVRRAAHATWWSTLEIAARYGVQFVVIVTLARLLAPADFGLMAMLLVFTALAGLLVDSGFSTALIQQQQTSADDETTVFFFAVGSSLLIAAVLWLAAPLIAGFYKQPSLVALTRLLVFALPLGALASVPDALLTQKLNFKARAKAEIIASLCSGLVAVALAWHGAGVWSLAWQSLIATCLRAILLWRYARWWPRGRFSTASFAGLARFGGYMLLAQLLNMFSIRLQSLLIGRMYDSRALGYYTLAQNTQEAPTQFVSNVLNRVGLPVFSTISADPAKLRGALRFSLRVSMFVFLPCMFGIAAVAKPLIVTLYGPRWVSAAPLLTLLALGAALWPLHVLNLAAIGAQGRSDLIFRLEVLKRLVSIGLILACSPGGPIGIAWAVLVSSLVAVAINTWYTHKLLDYGVLAQLRDQFGTLLLSVLAALAGWLTLDLVQADKVGLLVAVIVAACTYLGGAVACRHAALPEIVELGRILQERKTVPAATRNDQQL